MFRQKPFMFSLPVLLMMIILHLIGSYFSLYWLYPRYDVLVHIVSGLWVGLIVLWLASVWGQISSLYEYKIKSFLIAFVSAVMFGVAWELLENYGQITFTNYNGYRLDAAMDILNDGLGGVLAYFYFIKRRRCMNKNCETLHPFYNQTGIIKS